MEVTVNSKDFAKRIALVIGCVEKKTTIPILSNILIETRDSALAICATDLEQSVTVMCPATVHMAGATTLPGKRLQEYIGLLPDAEVSLKGGANNWTTIQCGRSKTRIAGMDRKSFPEAPAMPKPIATLSAKAMVGLIERTAFCISREESRFTLNGALAEFNGSMRMVATDGHRLANADQELTPNDMKFKGLLSIGAIRQLPKFLDGADTFELAEDANGYHFATADRVFYTRRLTGNFPDYTRIMPQDHSITLTLSKDEFTGCVSRVIRFADERSRNIRLNLNGDGLKLSSAILETGDSEETIPCAYSGVPIEIGFNGQYILDFLKTVNQSEVRLMLKDSQSAGELQPVYPDGTNIGASYRYIVMPMRV